MSTAPRLFDEESKAREMLIPALVKYDLLPSSTEVEEMFAARSKRR
jgi:hypothetical protein